MNLQGADECFVVRQKNLVYGTTLNDSRIARSNLHRAKIYPESDDLAERLRCVLIMKFLKRIFSPKWAAIESDAEVSRADRDEWKVRLRGKIVGIYCEMADKGTQPDHVIWKSNVDKLWDNGEELTQSEVNSVCEILSKYFTSVGNTWKIEESPYKTMDGEQL